MADLNQCGSSVISDLSYFGRNMCREYVQLFGIDRTHLLQTIL